MKPVTQCNVTTCTDLAKARLPIYYRPHVPGGPIRRWEAPLVRHYCPDHFTQARCEQEAREARYLDQLPMLSALVPA